MLLAASTIAESTRFWEQTTYQSLAKGTLDGLSLESDGSFRLGPRFDLIQEIDSAYVWDTVEDSRGNLYAAGGSPGRVYKIPPNGPAAVFFETKELEIDALAVDRQGRIYAAAAPDGAIYRITPDGKSSLYYNPQTKYIWALAFDSKDNLYVATGDKGQIFRVNPSGEGKLFFSSEETHIRSLIVDRQDNLVAGTDGNGLILRIQPDGTAFVLYESFRKEVTALALDASGTLYAAGVGDKPLAPGQTAVPIPAQTVIIGGQTVLQPPKSAPSVLTMNLAGGSEVYRITPDGTTQKLWASRNDIVYSLVLDPQGKLLVGTGNEGKIYRIEPTGLYGDLARSLSAQITSLVGGKGGVLVGSSNVGRLYRLRPEFANQGTFVSEVFDAGRASLWGRLQWRQELPPGTAIRFETRTGNSSNPLLNWSPWQEARAEGVEAVSQSPRARFFQWKAVLSSTGGGRTPVLSSVRAAYLPNNVAPVIEDVQNTSPGYRFQSNLLVFPSQPRTIVLQPLGSPAAPPPQQTRIPAPVQMTAEKGYVGVRWYAYDDNEDTLTYSVYLRGEGEKDWKLLKEGLSEMFYSWDSTNWPDGSYTAKVVASDSPSNPASVALSVSRESPPLEIDNTPPEISNLQCAPEGKRLKISFRAVDRRSTIQNAEYSVDGGEWRAAPAVARLSDSRQMEYQFPSEEVSGGEHTVVVRVTDRFLNVGVAKVVLSTAR